MDKRCIRTGLDVYLATDVDELFYKVTQHCTVLHIRFCYVQGLGSVHNNYI